MRGKLSAAGSIDETCRGYRSLIGKRFLRQQRAAEDMSEEVYDEGKLRKYLLGELNEAEQQAVEERLLTENELFELLPVVEDELIDDYLGGALSTEERSRFDSYFLSTPGRGRNLSFAMALRRYVTAEAAAEPAAPLPASRVIAHPSSWWKQAFSSPYLRLAAAAVIVLGLGIAIWRAFFSQSEVSHGMASLSEAYRIERPVEARISGLGYAPLQNTRGRERDNTDYVARDRAEIFIHNAVKEHPDVQSLHALGRLYLAKEEFDKAIDQFEKALKLEEENAELHSDCGAALLEMGKAIEAREQSGRSLEEFAKALAHLNRALELDGELLEALFNRALCHQRMKFVHQAEEDWRKYLARDHRSEWAQEARQYLKLLEQQHQKAVQNKEPLLQEFINAYQSRDDDHAWTIASQNKEAFSGKSILEQLLYAYLRVSLEGQSEEANRTLQAMSYLGELESRQGGDKFVSGLARFYRSLSPREVILLDEAQKLMSSGKSYYIQANNTQAIEAFGRAKRIFMEVGDEREALLADYYIAYSYSDKADLQHSKSMYEQLSPVFRRRNFIWLLMRVNVGLSVANFSLNNYSRAIEFASRSLELAKQMNDGNGALNAWSCLIEYYRYIGNYSQALHCVQESLPFIDPASLGVVQIWRHYAIIAAAFNSAEFYSAAIACQREALVLALRTDNPATLCVSYAHLGLMYAKAGNYDEAITNVQLAYETARSCPDEGVGKSQMAYAALQMGHLYRQTGDLTKALGSYDQSIDIYNSLQFPTFLYQAHKGKLTTFIAQQNDLMASHEIQVTLAMVEKYRSTILEGENRNSFFDIEQSVYDLAADFEYSRMNNPERAFEYCEESRGRSLLDSLTAQTRLSVTDNTRDIRFQTVSRPLPLERIRKRLPEGSQILHYAVLPNKILIWVITKDDFLHDEYIIDQNALNEKIIDYLNAISSVPALDGEDILPRAKALYDILISRVEPVLDRRKRLCIVPDKILTSLPFAALISTKTNEYLIRDYEITYSPSASIFVLYSDVAKQKESASLERALSIGDPTIDRNRFASLRELPSARAEVEAVADCYGPGLSRRLVGSEVRKSVVESQMGKFEVVHFALHSVVDELSPMRSKLVLAADPGIKGEDDDSKGVLESFEICKLNLPRTRLVVLSACQTGSGRYYKGEGMLSLARSFLVARVPLTVATLWAVDSNSTKELMIKFHKHRQDKTVSTAEALRRAQLEMLEFAGNGYSDPHHWAAFVAVGGQTSF